MIKLGTTFWGGFPDDPNTKHLWFVISDPDNNHGLAVIVNMTTYRAGSAVCSGQATIQRSNIRALSTT